MGAGARRITPTLLCCAKPFSQGTLHSEYAINNLRLGWNGVLLNILAVVSGKGGAGKSCVAAYTAAALAKAGKNTLLLELGRDVRSQDVILGLPETALFHSGDAASGLCDITAATSRINSNLLLIPAGFSRDEPISQEGLMRILNALPRDLDFLVVDGLDPMTFPFGLTDQALLVCTPDTLCVRASTVLNQALREKGAKDIRLVINRVPPSVQPIKGVADFDELIDTVGARLLAVIPESPKLAFASNNTEPLGEDSLTPQVFQRIAQRLLGQNSPLLVK